MSKTMKIWLIAAASLVFVGLIAFAVIMTVNGWDFTKLGTGKYETNTYEINEEFSNISIQTDTADIIFLSSDDENCTVICYEMENVKHSVSVTEGCLTVNVVDVRKWYEHVSVSFASAKITIYLPRAEYSSLIIEGKTGDVKIPNAFKLESIDVSVSASNVECYASTEEVMKIETTTGNINLTGISAGLIDLSVSTGNIYLTDVVCQRFISSGSTGDIYLKNVIATNKFSIERSTGNVKFDGSDAAEIFVETDTGDVTGSLLTDKIFITKSDTGKIEVPNSVAGGRCEITTDTGNIKLSMLNNQ